MDIALGTIDAIPQGEGRNFQVGEERIAVFHSRTGQVFAVQADCPHKGGPLADGLMGGRTLVCPLHGWKFDLATGEPLMGECPIKTYAVSLNASGLIVLST